MQKRDPPEDLRDRKGKKIMLEMLLKAYYDQFGVEFPLDECEDKTEIELINLIYECVQNREPYKDKKIIVNRFPDAPGAKK